MFNIGPNVVTKLFKPILLVTSIHNKKSINCIKEMNIKKYPDVIFSIFNLFSEYFINIIEPTKPIKNVKIELSALKHIIII